MAQVNDLSRSLASFEQSGTLVVVLEMSQSSWLAAGVVPGVERRPLKKISPDPETLLHLAGSGGESRTDRYPGCSGF
jgi:transposase